MYTHLDFERQGCPAVYMPLNKYWPHEKLFWDWFDAAADDFKVTDEFAQDIAESTDVEVITHYREFIQEFNSHHIQSACSSLTALVKKLYYNRIFDIALGYAQEYADKKVMKII